MIDTTIQDGVLIAAIHHPPTAALDHQTLAALEEAIDQVHTDTTVNGLVLTGQGRFFSTGFDLNTFLAFESEAQAGTFLHHADQVFLKLFSCTKPVICAMNGHAVAGGLILSMACDYRIVSDHPKVKIGMSEIRIGIPLSPVQSALMRWSLDGSRRLRDLLFFGKLMNGETALNRGVVEECMALPDLLDRSVGIARSWMENPGRPFLRMKSILKAAAVEEITGLLNHTETYTRMPFFFDPEVRKVLEQTQAAMG